MGDWISVSDRIPEKGVLVIVRDDRFTKTDNYDNAKGYGPYREPGVRFGYIFPSCEFRSEGVNGDCKITHWMPIPEPPNEK